MCLFVPRLLVCLCRLCCLRLSVHPSVCLPPCCLFVSSLVYSIVCLFVRLVVCLFAVLFVCAFVCVLVSLFACLFVCVCVVCFVGCGSACVHVRLFVF